MKIENFVRCMWRTESFSLNKNLSFDEYFLIESQLDESFETIEEISWKNTFLELSYDSFGSIQIYHFIENRENKRKILSCKFGQFECKN